MKTILWWALKIGIGFVSLFFLAIGIDTLIASYKLQNPLEFIMYFFSSNMLILVSAVGIIYTGFQLYGRLRYSENKEDE